VQVKGKVAETTADGRGCRRKTMYLKLQQTGEDAGERKCSSNCRRRERVQAKSNVVETAAHVRGYRRTAM